MQESLEEMDIPDVEPIAAIAACARHIGHFSLLMANRPKKQENALEFFSVEDVQADGALSE